MDVSASFAKMNIRVLQLLDGARQATGAAVIIDVFRAMSVEAHIIHQGAARLFPVADAQLAYDWKRQDKDVILIGERDGVKLPGFDFGNSPTEFADFDFSGKTVIHTTSAGTQGIENAVNATEIFTGSLVNARATAQYLLHRGFSTASLVCMGWNAVEPAEEDTLCAEYMRAILTGQEMPIAKLAADLKRTSGAKFFDPEQQAVFPQGDFARCTAVDCFDFVLKVEKDPTTGLYQTRKIEQ